MISDKKNHLQTTPSLSEKTMDESKSKGGRSETRCD